MTPRIMLLNQTMEEKEIHPTPQTVAVQVPLLDWADQIAAVQVPLLDWVDQIQ